jgi:perosamine synthetase
MSNPVNAEKFKKVISFISDLYPGKSFVALHEPIFAGNEKKYLIDCIDSTFVSSVGEYVNRFEKMVAEYTNFKYAVATTNGTSALHASLVLAGVSQNDEVITQALTFVATANTIAYCGARPIFIDSEYNSLGLCPDKLEEFLTSNVQMRDGVCFNKKTGRKIKACVPMHVFGLPLQIERISSICKKYSIDLIEDAAEALGSTISDQHVGHHGEMAILSFNGNKIVTCGGGGMILTNDPKLATKAKHITTTAKIPHCWEFVHDEIGYNYRLPNINAALACAQMEELPKFIENKRETAKLYYDFFKGLGIEFVSEPKGCNSNYWLNAILLGNEQEKAEFLKVSNEAGIMTRPLWTPMNRLSMYADCETTNLDVANDLYRRLVNIPSSVRQL